jgi:MYXO-CTERM domain-containing protein
MIMRNIKLATVAAIGVASCMSGLAGASVTITVVASSAPNYYGSPSWATYSSNAMYALRNGLANYGGDQSVTPTAYAALGASANVGTNMVSGLDPAYPLSDFYSWMGQSSPTGAFAAERGNRIHFGMSMVSSVGTQIQLDHIVVDITGSGILSALNASFNYVGNYSATRLGVLRGADGILGTGDDTVVNSGNANQFVDAVYVVGAGSAIWPDSPADMADFMNNWNSTYGGPCNLTGTYKLLDGAGGGLVVDSGATTVALTPAPGALALLGVAGLAGGRRRRA